MLVNIVFVLVAFAWLVLGGSRAWEAPLRHQVQLDSHRFEVIPVDEAGYAIRRVATNSTTGNNRKRWLGLRAGSGMNPSYLWPDKTISYCYDSTSSRDKLKEPLEMAFTMWAAGFEDGTAGLNRLVYKYVEVAKPGTACTKNSQSDKILLISHNDRGMLSSHVGRPPLDDLSPEYKGPVMQLSMRDDIGQLNTVANIAHEVGHAWGLLHEHQNPFFWRFPYGSVSSADMEGKVFGDYWDCSALKDYFLVRGKIINKHGAGSAAAEQIMLDVCQNHGAASHWGFSAADWLPIKANYRHPNTIPYMGASYEHVDWDSIMLYPSGAGGIGPARPPTNPSENPDVYDRRTPVLRRNDGAKIHTNTIPSKGDVAGIRFLYENPTSTGTQADAYVLPNNKKSSRFTDFIKDFMRKKNRQCGNPGR
ncbi:hypothetical protein RB601_001775 [Gaeumannomyces tritici]